MAQSKVAIYNAALFLLGEESVTSPDDDLKAARLCNQRFDPARDQLLRQHRWNFAITRAQLAADSTPPVWGYTNAFTLPSDCIRPLSIMGEPRDWKVEGGKILANYGPPIFIKYIARITDVARFDPLFDECLAARLAMDIAIPLTQDKQLWQLAAEELEKKIGEAKFANAIEGTPDDIFTDGSWLESRF